ncbi:hypothetical protein [Bradyrhizobium sp. dw_78]|uniref:hypothetical protein n=1 Tax=Bradyrhizobium sp. dw_78 TaxID=2719793 RepID=UPI001BD68937|nr:hypothetical protein [Bradyrhizobium sp. dw_78]
MKVNYRAAALRQKPKKQKKTRKKFAAASIAQQYVELQRLRAQLSEAETWRNAR